MDDIENKSRIRDRDWLYNALWTTCGDKRVPKCSLNIPVTSIFKDGMPFKSLETNHESGFIERLDLSDTRFGDRDLGEVDFQGLKDPSLRALRKVLVEFNDLNSFTSAQGDVEDAWLAKARFQIYVFIFC